MPFRDVRQKFVRRARTSVAALTAPYARVQEGTRPIRAEADQGAETAPTAIESGIRIFISGGVRRAANQSGAS